MEIALLYFCFLVEGVLPVPPTILVELQLALGILAVLCGRVIAPVALGALERNQLEIFRFPFGHLDLPGGS
jgi:hypothetical protein